MFIPIFQIVAEYNNSKYRNEGTYNICVCIVNNIYVSFVDSWIFSSHIMHLPKPHQYLSTFLTFTAYAISCESVMAHTLKRTICVHTRSIRVAVVSTKGTFIWIYNRKKSVIVYGCNWMSKMLRNDYNRTKMKETSHHFRKYSQRNMV